MTPQPPLRPRPLCICSLCLSRSCPPVPPIRRPRRGRRISSSSSASRSMTRRRRCPLLPKRNSSRAGCSAASPDSPRRTTSNDFPNIDALKTMPICFSSACAGTRRPRRSWRRSGRTWLRASRSWVFARPVTPLPCEEKPGNRRSCRQGMPCGRNSIMRSSAAITTTTTGTTSRSLGEDRSRAGPASGAGGNRSHGIQGAVASL